MRRGSPSKKVERERPYGGLFRPLTASDEARIIDHAFEILSEIGMSDAPEESLEDLVRVGGTVGDDGRIRFSRGVVEGALGRSPSSVELPGFDPDMGITVGEGPVHVGTGGAAVQTLDSESGEFRDSSLADLLDMMHVLDSCDSIDYGIRPLIARDMPVDLLDINTAYACLAATTKPIGLSFTSPETIRPVIDLFEMAMGGSAFTARPFAMAVVVHVVSPLRFSPEGCSVMRTAIEHGMIVQTCSAAQAGATSPAALAGAVAQGLAEVFAAVVFADAIKPGHPTIHALLPFISDLRTGAMSGGGGEAAIASAASAQVLRTLGIPHAVSAGISDAKVADVQSGYEKGYTVALAAQAGANMVQLSVGMLGSIMVASPESLVIDDEMCAAILRSVRGVEVTSEALDLDVISSVVSGEGHFLGQQQTLDLMRTEYVYPSLGDRTSVAEWLEAGSPSIWESAQARVADVLANGRHPHWSPEVDSQIRSQFDIRLDR